MGSMTTSENEPLHLSPETYQRLEKLYEDLYQVQYQVEKEVGWDRPEVRSIQTARDLLGRVLVMRYQLTPEEARVALSGKKIYAIKMVRERLHLGLREAKDLVETTTEPNKSR